MQLHIIYSLHNPVQDRPDWPNKGFDFNPFMENTRNILSKNCPEFNFRSTIASGPEEAARILSAGEAAGDEGFIVFQMNCWNQVVQTIAASGKPVLYADFQYGGSGGFLVYTAAFLRSQSPNVAFIGSSNIKDLISAVKCFNYLRNGGNVIDFASGVRQVRLQRSGKSGNSGFKKDNLYTMPADECQRRMNKSRILAVADENSKMAEPVMGIPVQYIPFSEVNHAWESADKDESGAVAERWMRSAEKVVGVSMDTLLTSAAMYVGMKSVLKKYEANAITINCLGGFYGGHIHAYPCLGFYELNNEGLVGACECDVSSTATMVAFSTITYGRPGYISDPVIDSGKQQIIYAHCVAPSKAFGPRGQENPFEILTHSEDRQGASVRSILPVGYLTTTLQVNESRKEILFHQARAVENDPDDRACRTKLGAIPIGDAEKLYTMWDRWGWHRVTFYGDLKKPVNELASQMGWQVIEET
jgi:hypothetical protein